MSKSDASRNNSSCLKRSIIILGASGDLAVSKLIPALYNILKQNKYNNFILLGAAYDDTTIDKILENAKKYIKNIDLEVWNSLKSRAYYQKLDFDNLKDFKKLYDLINQKEKEHNFPANRIAYLAAPAQFFCNITKNLVDSKIILSNKLDSNNYNIVVYEKPFGCDLESAKKINRYIKKYLCEAQVYRVDHYLAKVLVDAIKVVRFTNVLFEPVWDKNYIEQVQIIFSEANNIKDRGDFFDKFGILKDVIQNHCLQILSLIAMSKPKTFMGIDISKQKAKILNKIEVVDGVLGQFTGYKDIKGVSKNSKTDTFAAIEVKINDNRWQNVPFYIKSGKALKGKAVEVYIKFKPISKSIFRKKDGQDNNYNSNLLVIKIYPETGFSLELNTQKVKFDGQAEILPVTMDFCYECTFGYDSPEAYEILLLDIIRGCDTELVSQQEIESSWKIIEEVNKLNLPLYSYKIGSKGPEQANKINNKIINWYV